MKKELNNVRVGCEYKNILYFPSSLNFICSSYFQLRAIKHICKQFISSKRSEKKFTKHPKCKKKESEKVDWERRGPWVDHFQKESKPTWLCFRIYWKHISLIILSFLCFSFVKWIHDLLMFVSFSVNELLKFQVKRPGLLKTIFHIWLLTLVVFLLTKRWLN